ncbi:major facilitator superfamily domain-containing protein [Nemania abortiva]|nr:major facilitator superfamily domain-containing protein [Nemania abortiva]
MASSSVAASEYFRCCRDIEQLDIDRANGDTLDGTLEPNSDGIIQVALLKTTLNGATSNTVTFIGSLGIALSCLGIFVIPLAAVIGARWISIIGILVYRISNIASSWAVSSVGGMFVASGLLHGVGVCFIYAISNSLPVQWFDSRLGTANGFIKLGGGIGATVMSIVAGVLTDRLGVAWTFRIFRLLAFVIGVSPAILIRERVLRRQKRFTIDWNLFTDVPFCRLFAAGVVGVLSVYAPPFFLPAVATSLGFSPSVVGGVVASFNAAMTIGRVLGGFACDKLGSMNVFVLTMALNAVTMFAVWSFASTLPILIVFSIFNGISNGTFFTSYGTAVGRLADEWRGAGAIIFAITGWFPGLLVGNPIAALLIDSTGARDANSIVPYRPTIFYTASTALLSLAFGLVARLWVSTCLIKKL